MSARLAMRPGGRVRLLLGVAALALAALGVLVGMTAVRAVHAYNEMVEGRELLLAVEAELQREGLDATPAALADAEARAMSARDKFLSARSTMGGQPLLRLAEWTPWLGSQVSAARGLAGIGYEGSEIGLAGVAALDALRDVRSHPGSTAGEKAAAYMEVTAPAIDEVERRLAVIRRQREEIGSSWALPPLADLLRRLDERVATVEETVERHRHGRAVARHFLGLDGARTSLVLGMDNTELLPAGGLIGMYGVVTLDGGNVVSRSFGEVTDLTDRWQRRSGGEYAQPPGPLKRHLLRDWTWNLSLAGWSPDFPTAARRALVFYERSGAEPLEDVIAVDFTGLEGLLAVLGPQTVDGYGVTVDGGNVTREILARIGKPLRPGEGDHAFAAAVAMEIVDAVLAVDHGKWGALLRTLDRLAEEKHFFLYANDADVQTSVRELGWAGEVRETPGDHLMVVNGSVNSTKLNLVVEERIEVAARLDAEGDALYEVTLRYENRLGRWERTHGTELAPLMLAGLYGDYVRLLAPAGSRLVDVRLDGRSVGAEEVGREAGRASFGRYLALPRDSSAALTFEYVSPRAARASGSGREYRLLVQKQAGAGAAPLRLALTLPEGARVESVRLEGTRLQGDPLLIDTDLSRDREVVVRYEP